MGTLYGVDGDLFERQYRNHLSGYLHWEQLAHAENWLLFEKNIGAYVCIDEVALSRGELYTVLINKEAHGGKGSIIAIIKGTAVCTVTSVLLKLSRRRRYQVREITLDMAPNMAQIARTCFPAAKRVTDRFHVQKLAYEAVQEMRVKARWEALDEESIQIAYAKACGKMYHAPVFANGDTRKQLLARSIYLLYKKESLWTQSQRIRAEILFKEYLTNATDKLPELSIMLPVKDDGTIDYDYMEIRLPVDSNDNIDYTYITAFIKAQEKLSIRNVIDWKDKIINTSKKCI